MSEQSQPGDPQHIRTLAEALPALVFVADADGRNLYTNGQFQTFTGLESEELLDEGWLRMVHPDDRACAVAMWTHAVASGEPYEAEYRFRRHDGQSRVQ